MIEKLYDTLKPTAYELTLNIDSEKLEFSGTVGIKAKLIKKTSRITLHSKELDVHACSVGDKDAPFSLNAKNDTLTIELTEPLEGKVEIAVKFRGKITDAMHGMYPCYFEHDGKKKKLIATQFESHHAREVFPCVDEPAAKATFDVELITNEGEVVLSNMPVKKQRTEANRLVTQFDTTPVMSTYLLAFVAGEMVCKESETKDGVIVRSWASAAQNPEHLEYSVKETVDLIEFYNDYFDVAYPLPKCDQVALPDFESAAMENWGLVTYRETVFLSDPSNVSLSTQQYISLVVAHELSHQWFGNLVTMKWWDDLWLNESFANMTEYLAVDKLHPEWNIWEEFVAHDALSATNRDAYSDVQSVRVTVNHPSDIHTLFDPSIVYAKGGKLLKMLLDLLGEEAWRAGLKDYFIKNAYKNTSRDDLWEALNKHSTIDVPKLMNQWIEHAGQPLVTVDQDKNIVKISQQRLLLDGKKDDAIWQIPLLDDSLPITINERTTKLELSSEAWVRLNQSGVGHYISNYTNPAQKAWIAEQLASPDIESTWKITRLNELTMLAKHGDTNLSEALEATKFSAKETRAMVWSLLAGIVGNARMLTEDDEAADKRLKQLAGDIAKDNFTKLGWDYPEQEDSNETHLRTITLGMMLASETQSVIDHALKVYRAANDPELLPAEIRSMLMGAAVKFGTSEEFVDLINRYKVSSNAEYRSDITAALTSTKSTKNLKMLHNLMIDTSIVRPQDLRQWYAYLLRNRYTRHDTWQWLVDNWSWIMENFEGSKSYDDFARYSASFFSTDEMLQKYISFFGDKKEDPALKRAIAIGTEEIKARVAWRKRDQEPVTEWLKNYN